MINLVGVEFDLGLFGFKNLVFSLELFIILVNDMCFLSYDFFVGKMKWRYCINKNIFIFLVCDFRSLEFLLSFYLDGK